MTRRRVLFRLDAGSIPEIGTGHLARDRLLASALAERGCEVAFCGRFDDSAAQATAQDGITVIAGNGEGDPELLERAVGSFRPHVLVIDRLDTAYDELARVRDAVPVIVTLDDAGAGAELADVVVNAIVGGGSAPYESYEYLVVAPPQLTEPASAERPRVVISFGGYDHGDIGPAVAGALAARGNVDVVWVVRAKPPVPVPPGVEVVEDPPDFGAELRSADVAVLNGGMSLFEALANGVPAIAVPQYDHQAQTIHRLANAGAVVPIEGDDDLEAAVTREVDALIADPERRRALTTRGLETVDGLGLGRLSDLIVATERLAWDSEYFGLEVARIYPHRLTPRLLQFALEECADFDCVYYLCDCHHAESVRLAEEAGFHFVDIRLTLERAVTARGEPPLPGVRDARPDDLPALQEIARGSYMHTRYWFDHHFPRDACARFYSDWIAKCVSEELADRVFVFDDGSGPLGYIAVIRDTLVTCSIVLLGVSDRARGRGVGRLLIDAALDWASTEGYSRIQVVTQGRNYEAQRAYGRSGFLLKRTELWYHLWPQLGR